MKESRLNGLFTWSVHQPDRGIDFNAFFWKRDRGNLLIDPLPLGADDLAHVLRHGGARFIVVTNIHHLRDAIGLRARFGARLLAPAQERHEFAAVSNEIDAWIDAGAPLAPGLEDDVSAFALAGTKTPGELVLHLAPLRALVFGDSVRSHRSGELCLLPDAMIKDKHALLESLRPLIPLDFDAVLLGDGDSLWKGGREALYDMLESLPGVLFNRINIDQLLFSRRSDRAGAINDVAQLSRHMTCRGLGFHMRIVHPGSVTTAYHYETGEEEIFLIRRGELTVRTPQGTFTLKPGDLVAFPTGPANAHQFRNDGTEPCEFLALSTNVPNSLAVYPDTGKIMVGERSEQYRIADRLDDYWVDDPSVP